MCAGVIAAVVLAAGASTRLGEPKQLVKIGGETLLERAVRTAREAGCEAVVVVLGAAVEQICERCDLSGAVVVMNPRWQEGMASSIQAGLRAVQAGLRAVRAEGGAEGVVVMMCDQPAVTAKHLRALMASGAVMASAYAGRRGVPAYFPVEMLAELMKLRGDAGAKDMLREAAMVELVGGELDVDTAADLDEAKRRFG